MRKFGWKKFLTNGEPGAVEKAKAFLVAFEASGLFQADWYLASYPDLAAAKVRPLQHFLEAGWREGRRPNPIFDAAWYVRRYPDIAAAGMNPLIHYWQYGEKENRQPVAYFDTEWYRATYKNELGGQNALAHFLRHRNTRRFSPNRFFEYDFYLRNNPDVAAADVDPFQHFITTGYKEGRNPSPAFHVLFYVRMFMQGDSRDPLSHYFEVGRAAGYSTQPTQSLPTQTGEIRRFTTKGPDFEELALLQGSQLTPRGKVVAFYLPQFHSFPENDRWWGKGFTEWTNVARATPRFEGHYQPRIPRDLGFYDLGSPGILERQVAMAKAAGIHGFCFYYYNFNGKRLLDRPVEQFLSNPSLDQPFCLMWANENWTRRWDGAESEILMRQDYRDEDIDALIDDIARHFRDKRYIRAEGRPLFILYRPDVVPNMASALEVWRSKFEQRHEERPIILMAQGFGNTDPRDYGFDGAIEFPPHKVASNLPKMNESLRFFDATFTAPVHQYDDVVSASISEAPPNFPLIKTIFPSWDNDARRQGHGMVVAASTPKKYERWLDEALRFAKKSPAFGESFVFVNAWNEWAEGAYLEPDVYYGGAYLNATARAIVGVTPSADRRRLVLIGHDAHPHGAQLLLLNIGKMFAQRFGFSIAFVLCNDGEMVAEYNKIGPTAVCADAWSLRNEISRLASEGFDVALTNTVVSGAALPSLKDEGFRVVSLIHELPRIIREKSLASSAELIGAMSDEVVFPAASVQSAFEQAIRSIAGNPLIRPQGIYHEIEYVREARLSVREELGFPPNCKMVVNVGYADLRKGVDLFCRVSQLLALSMPDVRFVWVGNVDPVAAPWFDDIRAFGNVVFAGQRKDIDRILSAADVFALTSREDPFPSVVLEALSVDLPVVAFDDAGGFADLLRPEKQGTLVAYCDVDAMARAIEHCLADEKLSARSPHSTETLRRRFAFDDYAFWLASRLDPSIRKISVVIPNYNYAKYLRERLVSVFEQTHPVFEVIVLDDASTDDSIAVIDQITKLSGRSVRLIRNEKNSGSPFAQWKKGIQAAKGDLLWIAEADDIADRTFLSQMVRYFNDGSMTFAFSDSTPVDADGRPLGKDYKDYYARVFPNALAADLKEPGPQFASNYLSQRNTILNVSSVLWRRDILADALEQVRDDLASYKLAGDWLLYLTACARDGSVGYSAKSLNLHRRHAGGVTSQTVGENQLSEITRLHEYANRLFRPSSTTLSSQESYIRELTSQFLKEA